MTTSNRPDTTTAELLVLIQRMQTKISALEQQRDGLRRASFPWGNPMVPLLTAPFGRCTGRRTGRARIGAALACLLLLAPWGSEASYAAGPGNTAYGDGALTNNTGSYNSAFGVAALNANTSGNHNQASGSYSLTFNTTGSFNSATGPDALKNNATGSFNTASGSVALFSNTTGGENTASGEGALYNNTSGSVNTASGVNALGGNTTGSVNTASGEYSLYTNVSGYGNSAFGFQALFGNTSGGNNTAVGIESLASNTTGSYNTAIGDGAGYTAIQGNANTTGSDNTFIGHNSGPGTPSEITNATAIGANAVVSQSNAIVLGGTGPNTQRIGVGTSTPHSALQIAVGYMQYRAITGAPPANACSTAADAGRTVVRTDGTINLYVCTGTGGWIGK